MYIGNIGTYSCCIRLLRADDEGKTNIWRKENWHWNQLHAK